MKIIGLTGKAGVGKDTVADYLCKKGYVKYSFAKPLKDMLKVIGVDCDNRETKELPHPTFGVSPRRMAQTLGTEWMRNSVAADGWLLLAQRYVEVRRNGNQYADELTYSEGVVFSDVRFENEADFIRKQGTVIHVHRNVDAVQEHVSETGVRYATVDRWLMNDRTTNITFRRLDDIMADL